MQVLKQTITTVFDIVHRLSVVILKFSGHLGLGIKLFLWKNRGEATRQVWHHPVYLVNNLNQIGLLLSTLGCCIFEQMIPLDIIPDLLKTLIYIVKKIGRDLEI